MTQTSGHSWLLKTVVDDYHLTCENVASEIQIPMRTLKNLYKGHTTTLQTPFWHKLLAFYCYLRSQHYYIEFVNDDARVCFRKGLNGKIICLPVKKICNDVKLLSRFSTKDQAYLYSLLKLSQ